MRRTPIRRVSEKRLKANGGKLFSTISSKPKRIRKRPGKAEIVRRRRTKKDFARIYGSRERVRWIKDQPCAACGVVGFSENAHSVTGGMGRKADCQTILPLCGPRIQTMASGAGLRFRGCHAILHQHGRAVFESRNGIDLDACARATSRAWQESQR